MKHHSLEPAYLLSRAAVRAAEDPAFMANALKSYAGGELNFGHLARFFHADRTSIVKLALCKRPRADADSFASDVLAIASASGISAAAIANSLRQVDALEALRQGAPVSLMAAARDHIEPPSEGGTEDL